MRDFGKHRRHRGASPRPVLDVVELAGEVAGRAAGEGRGIAHPFQIGPVAAPAGRGAVAGGDEGGAARDAAFGHIGGEFRVRIAELPLFRVVGHFDNALPERGSLPGIFTWRLTSPTGELMPMGIAPATNRGAGPCEASPAEVKIIWAARDP